MSLHNYNLFERNFFTHSFDENLDGNFTVTGMLLLFPTESSLESNVLLCDQLRKL